MTDAGSDRIAFPTWEKLESAARARAEGKGISTALAMNAGTLIRAAAAHGWDIIVPGSNHDYPSDPPSEVTYLGPVAGIPIDEAKSITPAGSTIALPATTFLFDAPDLDIGDQPLYEIHFNSSPSDDVSYATFRIDLVEPESQWGFPDFREPIDGWFSVLGNEAVIAWRSPEDHGAAKAMLSDEQPEGQRFWVNLARAIAAAYFAGSSL